jgi:hypothetical protein
MYTTPDAPGTAKFLLNWPTADANVTSQSGASFLARVRSLNSDLSDQIVLIHDDPDRAQRQFVIQQWRDIEELLVERDPLIPVSQLFEYVAGFFYFMYFLVEKNSK